MNTRYCGSELLPYGGRPDKKRLLSAFRREPVDRVPNFEVLYEDVHVERLLGRYAGNTLAVGGAPAKGAAEDRGKPMAAGDYIELCNHVGQDALIYNAGFWTPFKKRDSTGQLVQVSDKSIKSRRDFSVVFLDSDGQISAASEHLRQYKDAISPGNEEIGVGAVYGCIMQTLYEFLVGTTDFMLMVHDDILLIEEILEQSAEHYTRMTKKLVEGGIDFIRIADDVAYNSGLLIHPTTLRDIWIPRIGRMIEPAVNARVPVMFHSDGKVDQIVENLIDIGVSCLNPMDPNAVDYVDYKKRYGSRLSLSGNINILFPLTTGTPEDVYDDVRSHMRVLKPGYGYIASSSHSITSDIPHENLIAYLNAVHEYGRY